MLASILLTYLFFGALSLAIPGSAYVLRSKPPCYVFKNGIQGTHGQILYLLKSSNSHTIYCVDKWYFFISGEFFSHLHKFHCPRGGGFGLYSAIRKPKGLNGALEKRHGEIVQEIPEKDRPRA